MDSDYTVISITALLLSFLSDYEGIKTFTLNYAIYNLSRSGFLRTRVQGGSVVASGSDLPARVRSPPGGFGRFLLQVFFFFLGCSGSSVAVEQFQGSTSSPSTIPFLLRREKKKKKNQPLKTLGSVLMPQIDALRAGGERK